MGNIKIVQGVFDTKLEQQLQNSGTGGKTVWIVIALIAIVALIISLLTR